jgi:hypothetical protein
VGELFRGGKQFKNVRYQQLLAFGPGAVPERMVVSFNEVVLDIAERATRQDSSGNELLEELAPAIDLSALPLFEPTHECYEVSAGHTDSKVSFAHVVWDKKVIVKDL